MSDTLYCGDSCNHTGPCNRPPEPSAIIRFPWDYPQEPKPLFPDEEKARAIQAVKDMKALDEGPKEPEPCPTCGRP